MTQKTKIKYEKFLLELYKEFWTNSNFNPYEFARSKKTATGLVSSLKALGYIVKTRNKDGKLTYIWNKDKKIFRMGERYEVIDHLIEQIKVSRQKQQTETAKGIEVEFEEVIPRKVEYREVHEALKDNQTDGSGQIHLDIVSQGIDERLSKVEVDTTVLTSYYKYLRDRFLKLESSQKTRCKAKTETSILWGLYKKVKYDV